MKRRSLSSHGLTILDTLITLCLIGVLIGVVIPRYERVARVAREEAVRTALVNIRSSIVLFKALNGRYPRSLGELIEKNVILPGRTGSGPYAGSFFKRKYLMSIALDTRGNVIDAFGNPFIYDPAAGEVRSSTQEYKTW